MKLIMKICLFALVFASCTKSSNNGGGVGGGGNNGTTINYSDYYAEITFNGNTYKTVGSASTGALVSAGTMITYPGTFDTINLVYISIDGNGFSIMKEGIYGNIAFYKPSGGLTTGIYKSTLCKWKNGYPVPGVDKDLIFKDPNNAGYLMTIKDSTLSVNVTNINSKLMEGAFNCILQNNSGEFPATGKFKAYRL